MKPQKITYYGGSELPNIAKPKKVEEPKPWDGSNSSPSIKRPSKSRRKTRSETPSPAPMTEQSSKQDPTDSSSVDLTDGDQINFDFN
jgi:hypothetical protein